MKVYVVLCENNNYPFYSCKLEGIEKICLNEERAREWVDFFTMDYSDRLLENGEPMYSYYIEEWNIDEH